LCYKAASSVNGVSEKGFCSLNVVDMRHVGASDMFRDGIARGEGMQYHCAGLHRLYTYAQVSMIITLLLVTR